MAEPTRAGAPLDLGLIRALTFDVGGTVFDWHGTIRDAIQALAQANGVSVDAAQLANTWRRGMLERVGRVRTGELAWQNADALHRVALDDVLAGTPLAGLGADERDELTRAWHRLRAWPDAVPALARLRQRYTIVVLSILNFSLLVDSSKQAGIQWDGIISCEFLQRYKDDPVTYRTAVQWLGLRPEQAMMVAAHPWDLKGAMRVGLRSAHVPRPGEWGEPETRDLSLDPALGIDLAARDFADLAAQLTN
ncbi:MAG: haloacid dehalogenase type II [Dehalococcoidia bacterium]